jgi:polar amino acid transport system substrate-binding protein
MPIIRWPTAACMAVVSLWLAACAGVAPAPDAQARQALAPTGKLRVALYAGSPTSLVRDPATGETKGVGLDLGAALAARLGVPVELLEFASNAQALEALKAARADFAFTNATAARARDMDFSPAVLEVEQGYLVAQGSPLTVATMDRPGVRVGVSRGSTSEGVLARQLKNATVTGAPTIAAGAQMLALGKIDAFATNKAILFEMSDGLPGSRVLEGRYGLETFAVAIPKGREPGWDALRRFVAEARSEGVVKRAVGRAGLRGTGEPAPP